MAFQEAGSNRKQGQSSRLYRTSTGVLNQADAFPRRDDAAGPAVQVGEHATNTVALVFHEMATKLRRTRYEQWF
jgi:hypothetical protein